MFSSAIPFLVSALSPTALAGDIVVADRASGTLSVIDTRTDTLAATIDLPDDADPPEPMYVVHVGSRVFVGDRANDRVLAYDAHSYALEGSVEVGAGVFHMWAAGNGSALWVNNDIDNTTAVVDPGTLELVGAFDTPADLVALGGFPHDVVVDQTGSTAWISVLGVDGDFDYVVQVDGSSLEETGRAAVGKDPHLSLSKQSDQLYVACQGGNAVYVLDPGDLSELAVVDLPGAHGAAMSGNGRTFYTTNLPGGGADGLFAIDTRDNSISVDGVDTPFATPHNLALTSNNKKLYVTHSGGTAETVTVYEMTGKDPTPVYVTEVTVGLNPFGLAYVP